MYISNEGVDRAIEGLGRLGIHAEVAIQSATNKLRCKTLSDMLFIQNIPPHIKENKVNMCNARRELDPDAIKHLSVEIDWGGFASNGLRFCVALHSFVICFDPILYCHATF